jgi:phospholipid/cholesterol/gamma-HCH transport system permease protein
MPTTAPTVPTPTGEPRAASSAPSPAGHDSWVAEVGELVAFGSRALRALPGSARYLAEALRHASGMVVRTSPLLLVMYVFMGIVTMNTGYFLLFPLGAADYLGAIGGFGIHVSAVIMFSYVFTAKVCGGFVAEIGAMRINQEIDAYESTGVDPLRFVVGTRVIATLLYIPIAAVVGLVGYVAGCYLDGVLILQATDFATYSRFHWSSQGLRELGFVFTTVTLTGVATAITACFYGMRTTGGPAAVGAAVAQAVKVNLVLANLVAAFTVITWYGADAGVPIGG